MGVGDKYSLKVYVRLPTKISEEIDVKDLHPDIQTVQLSRQKSRWCFIIFQDEKTRDGVISFLKKLRLDGKPIIVKPFKYNQHKKKLKSALFK